MPDFDSEAVVGRQLRLPHFEGTTTTGLTLGSYTVVGWQDGNLIADPVTDWGITLTEIDSVGAAGEYELLLTPPSEGTFVLRLERGGNFFRWVIRSRRRAVVDVALAMEGGASRVQITVEAPVSVPIEDVLVRIYANNQLVTSGSTDLSGIIRFDLAPGSYEIQLSKTGFTFTNPTALTVPAGDEEPPFLNTFLPTSLSVGDQLALRGRFFSPTLVDNEVVFTTSIGTTTVTADATDATGEMLVVTVPVIGQAVTNVLVQKPDPANLPLGRLPSNTVTVGIV